MIIICSLLSFGLGLVASVIFAAYVSKATFRTGFVVSSALMLGAVMEGLTGLGGEPQSPAVPGSPVLLASVISLWLGCVATYAIADVSRIEEPWTGTDATERDRGSEMVQRRIEDGA